MERKVTLSDIVEDPGYSGRHRFSVDIITQRTTHNSSYTQPVVSYPGTYDSLEKAKVSKIFWTMRAALFPDADNLRDLLELD